MIPLVGLESRSTIFSFDWVKESYLGVIYAFHMWDLLVNWVFSVFEQEESGLNCWYLSLTLFESKMAFFWDSINWSAF